LSSLDKKPPCSACAFYHERRIAARGSNKALIVLVGDCPSPQFPEGGEPFQDRNGISIGMALKRLQVYYNTLPNGPARWFNLKPYKTYVVQCVHVDKPKKDIVTRCRQTYLDVDLAIIKPRLVIACGAMPLQTLLRDPKAAFEDNRGSFIARTLSVGESEQHPYELFTTYSPKAVLAKPGLYDEMYRDLQRAFLHAEGCDAVTVIPEETLRKNYRFPDTVQEVKEVCDEILTYANNGADPNKHFIAVDIETSCLEMHDPTAKIIMVSFAWARMRATSIFIDHPRRRWSPEDREQIVAHVRRVLASDKPKVLHHEKFDRQGIVHRYGWELNNVVWDTMGGEHLLEEDKKGAYGLKILTRSRLPEYAGYEDKVAEIREEHGGGTRADEAKRFRKATLEYQKACTEYTTLMSEYDLSYGTYLTELTEWEAKKDAEKLRADAARKAKEPDKTLRSMNKDAYGPKPKKPHKPKEPKEPVHHEPFDFTMIDPEDLKLYAGVDADVTRQHAVTQNTRMAAEHKKDVADCLRFKKTPPLPFKRLMSTHVIPTSRTLADIEFTGFPVDLPYLEELDAKLEIKVAEAQSKLFEMAGGEFVIDNPAALGKIMFNDGFYQNGQKVLVPRDSNIKHTSRGQTKSDEGTLKYIANTYGFDFPRLILDYRKARKARAPFLINVREHARFDRRMHASFHLAGTGTGRLSSSNENLQNIPKKLAGVNIKKIFIPPPGYTLINTDAKGAEIRIFATYSHDEKLIKAILDGLDTHSFFTSQVFGVTYEDVEMARDLCDRYYAGEPIDGAIVKNAEALVRKRTNCKRVVFGTLYGAMAAKIAETAGISLEEAQRVIDLMFKMFPSIPAYIESTQNEVRFFNWVATLTGRKRRFPLSVVRMFRNRCFRQAVNFKIQSTSSDIVLWVMNQIHPVVKHDLRGQFHATVHDSIVFSVPHAYVPQVKDIMYEYGTRRAQIEFPWLSVPFLWDVEAGPSYGEVTDVNKYLQGQLYHDKITAAEEVITDEEIRDEINESLAS